jgi:hypothetical protein
MLRRRTARKGWHATILTYQRISSNPHHCLSGGHPRPLRTLAHSPDGPAPRSADKQMQGQEFDVRAGTPQRTPMPLRLLWWSFSRSFHRTLLQPTRPHSTECLPNLTCLEPTGTGSAEDWQLSPKQRRTRRRASRPRIPNPPPNHIRRRRRSWSGGVQTARQDDRSMPERPAFGRVVDIATRPARPG